MAPDSAISILIRSYNSEKTLPRLLGKLDLLPEDEILVVDSGSDDGTREVALRFGARFIEAPLPFSYSKSLNAGFRVAKNPLVHVLSSHALPMVSDLLGRMRALAAALPDDVWAIYGPAGISGRDDLGVKEPVLFGQADCAKHLCIIGNANTLYRLTAWEKLPFDEGIRTDEDKTWARSALQSGCQLAYAPLAPILNKSNYSLAYMFRKGQSDSRAVKKENAPAMTLWQLGGALKKMLVRKIKGEIDWGNWIRYSAHIFGTFSGSRLEKDNTPRKDPRVRP
jgi:glycosyltransferase involved in cell wall biosynthesis